MATTTQIVAGVKLYGLMDTYSAEMAEVYETLFDPRTDELRKNVKELLGNVTYRNILVIDRVEILPAYRGIGLGLATIWDILQRHSAACGIVALKAFPFQFRSGNRSGRLGFLEESGDQDQGAAGLRLCHLVSGNTSISSTDHT